MQPYATNVEMRKLKFIIVVRNTAIKIWRTPLSVTVATYVSSVSCADSRVSWLLLLHDWKHVVSHSPFWTVVFLVFLVFLAFLVFLVFLVFLA